MGGLDSEIGPSTRLIALESAYFHPESVRRTSKRLGLKTEASIRFERGGDVSGAAGRNRARGGALCADRRRDACRDVHRSLSCAAGDLCRFTLREARIGGCSDRKCPRPTSNASSPRSGSRLTGVWREPDRAGTSASRRSGSTWCARRTSSKKSDVITAFDRLPATFPALTTPQPAPGPGLLRERLVRQVLTAAGFSECMTFAFIEREAALPFCEPGFEPIADRQPALGEIRRPPAVAARRPRRFVRAQPPARAEGHPAVRIGQPLHLDRRGPRGRPGLVRRGERTALVGVAGKRRLLRHEGRRRTPVRGVRHRRGVRRRRQRLSRPRPRRRGALPPQRIRSHPRHRRPDRSRRSPRHVACRRRRMCTQPSSTSTRIDATSDATAASSRCRGIPSIVRDISIVVDDTLPAAAVRGTIRSAAPSTLVSIVEFDRYQGKGVPEGRVSLSLRLTFRAADRTLTDAEAQDATEDNRGQRSAPRIGAEREVGLKECLWQKAA